MNKRLYKVAFFIMLVVVFGLLNIKSFTNIQDFKFKDFETRKNEVSEPVNNIELYQLDKKYVYSSELSGNKVDFEIMTDREWELQEINVWSLSDDVEASPDCGIHIKLSESDTTNFIVIIGSIPRISIPDYDEILDFTTEENISGRNYIKKYDDKIVQRILLYDTKDINYNFLINMSKEFYIKNNRTVMKALESFRLL